MSIGTEAISPPDGTSPAETPSESFQIKVGAALAQTITTITRADVTLSASVGETADSQRVLIPFLELALTRALQEEEPFWIGRLTLDNVAFLLEQISVGLFQSMDALEAMSLGDLRPTTSRIEYSADRAASAGENLLEAASRLRVMAERARKPQIAVAG